MSPLNISCPNVKTNLLPNEIKEARAAKRELLILANAVAAILMAIFIFAAFAASQFTKTQEIVRQRKEKILPLYTHFDIRRILKIILLK